MHMPFSEQPLLKLRSSLRAQMAFQGLLFQLEPRSAARHEPPAGDRGRRRRRSRSGERQERQRVGCHALERVRGGQRGRRRTKVVWGRRFIIGYRRGVVIKRGRRGTACRAVRIVSFRRGAGPWRPCGGDASARFSAACFYVKRLLFIRTCWYFVRAGKPRTRVSCRLFFG